MTNRDTSTSPHTAKSLLAQLTLAGAAALAGSSANAQVTVVSVNETVGVGAGELTSFTSALPGSSQFGIGAAHSSTHFPSGLFHRQNVVNIGQVNGSFTINAGGGFGTINTPYGFQFNTFSFANMPFIGGGWLVNSNHFTSTYSQPTTWSTFRGLFGPTPYYLSFRFAPTLYGPPPYAGNGGPFDYGWLELSGITVGGGKASVTIDSYAYDVSGAKIPNGYIPPDATFVPEPSSEVALAAFSALALGAVGMRRLKALHAAAQADKPVEGTL